MINFFKRSWSSFSVCEWRGRGSTVSSLAFHKRNDACSHTAFVSLSFSRDHAPDVLIHIILPQVLIQS